MQCKFCASLVCFFPGAFVWCFLQNGAPSWCESCVHVVLIVGAKFAHVAAAQSRGKMTWLVGSNIGVSLVLFGAKLWSTGAKFVWLVVSTPLKNIGQLG